MNVIQKKKPIGTVILFQTTRFTTVRLRVTFRRLLDEDQVTTRGLLPYVMQAVNKRFKTRNQFYARLEELYGATLDVVATRTGLTHNIVFDMHVVDQNIVNEQTLLQEAIELLHIVLFEPYFDTTILEEEKRKVKEHFLAIHSDKLRYSFKQLKDAIFRNQIYRLDALGKVEDLPNITVEHLKQAYFDMIQNDRIDISIVGNIGIDSVEKWLQKYWLFSKRDSSLSVIDKTKPIVYNNPIIEHQTVKQAKLTMAYSLPVYIDQKEYQIASVLNTILGGSSESILFQKLREELGKVYFISSSFDPMKGVLYIYAGVNQGDVEIVFEEIDACIKQLKQKNVSDKDISLAKKWLSQNLVESLDSTGSILARLSVVDLLNRSFDINESLKQINGVSKEEIQNLSQKITPIAKYVLKGEQA